nr:hypothetical protein BaRGS_034684 [Batillaria attramentaria]
MCTAHFAAKYLHDLKFKDKVFLVGCPAMGTELDAVGIRHIGIGPYPYEGSIKEWLIMNLDPEVKCVLVGYDSEVSYMKSMHASTYLQQPDCLFLATSEDTHVPVSDTQVCIPDAGTMVQAVSLPSERVPTILGKPQRHMFDLLRETHNLDPARTVIVGDNLDTDIGLAKACGLKSLLVLTGVTAESELPQGMQDTQAEPKNTCTSNLPDLYTPRVADLASFV